MKTYEFITRTGEKLIGSGFGLTEAKLNAIHGTAIHVSEIITQIVLA